MNYISCSSCSNGILVLREGPHGTFIGCTNYPCCHFTANLDEFDKKDLDLIRYPSYAGRTGECNRCGQIRTLNDMGLCSVCEEWFEAQ